MPRNAPNKVKMLCFDLDDTLWAVKPTLIAAEKKVAAFLNEHCPEVYQRFDFKALAKKRHELVNAKPALEHQISQQRIETMFHAIAECGYSNDHAKKLSAQAFEVFIDARHQVDYFPGAVNMLEVLCKQYRIAALTNGNAYVSRLSIGKYFEFSINAEEINASKPSPDHFEQAIARAGLQADQLIHIGDHPEHDIYGAHRLGIKTVWVNLENKQWQESFAPSIEVNAVEQLPAAIARLDSINN